MDCHLEINVHSKPLDAIADPFLLFSPNYSEEEQIILLIRIFHLLISIRTSEWKNFLIIPWIYV